jgi:hypothetical protein
MSLQSHLVMSSSEMGPAALLLEKEEIDWPALTTARIVAMVVLGVVSFLLGMLPWALVKIFKLDIEGLMRGNKSKVFFKLKF